MKIVATKDCTIPAPDYAQVGQTIVVSEVDVNGKPIKWEAADVVSAEPDMVITVEKDSFNAGDYSEVAVIESGSAENVVAKLLSGQIPVIVYKHDKVYGGVRYIHACVAQAYAVSGNTLVSSSFIHSTHIIHVVFNSDGTLSAVTISDI